MKNSVICNLNLLSGFVQLFDEMYFLMEAVVLEPQSRLNMPQSESHSLVEINRSDWKSLLDLYKHKRLEANSYGQINNYIKWLEADEKYNIKIYSLDGEWQSDGTFVLIVDHGTKYKEVSSNTLSDNLDRLTKALLCLNYDDKDNPYILVSYPKRLSPAIDALKVKYPNLLGHTGETVWYHASKELVSSFTAEPPAGFELRSLDEEHAEPINEFWPHRMEGSEKFVRALIKHNLSVGAFDEHGNLAAYCLRLPTGSLGLLQVREAHRRLGLGSLLVRHMAKEISALGDEVLAPVVTENTASRSMFEKLGFKPIDYVYWTY